MFVYKDRLIYAFSLIAIFSILSLSYWFFFSPFIFELISKMGNSIFYLLLSFSIGLFLLRKFDLNKMKSSVLIVTIMLISLLFSFLILGKIIVFKYPVQILISFIPFFVLILIGFFNNKGKNLNNFFKISIGYFVIFLIGCILVLNKVIYCIKLPVRILEFGIFPCSVIASFGFFQFKKKIKIKYLLPFSVITLIFLATLIYPTIFIYKKNFVNTAFYDIRNDLRYIPKQGFELIEWANQHGYSVRANNYVINEYQKVFYMKKDKELLLITSYDYRISENYAYIKDNIGGIPNPQNLIEKAKGLKRVYSNEWGSLYRWK